MQTSLPSHRQFFTSLIDSLVAAAAAPPAPQAPTAEDGAEQDDGGATTNGSPRRQLLLTLHVLFPAITLPALDLLDRRLVTRLTCPELTVGDDTQSPAVYVIRSGSGSGGRRHDTATNHIVRMSAWNCSCERFAQDAFAALLPEPMSAEVQGPAGVQAEHAWEFGGLSMDGTANSHVPCCKHLLACLLVQQWGQSIAAHAEHKQVTREELAGITAGLWYY